MRAVLVDRLDDAGCGVHVEITCGPRGHWVAECFAQRADSPYPHAQMPATLVERSEEELHASVSAWLVKAEMFAFGPREHAIALWWSAKEAVIDTIRRRPSGMVAEDIDAWVASRVADREREAQLWRALPPA
jgi:hypothetical protein